MTTAAFLGVHCPVLHSHCGWSLQPQAGLPALPAPAAHLHAEVAAQRQASAAEMGGSLQGAEQSRHPCARSPNITHGDWWVETTERAFYKEGKKSKELKWNSRHSNGAIIHRGLVKINSREENCREP